MKYAAFRKMNADSLSCSSQNYFFFIFISVPAVKNKYVGLCGGAHARASAWEQCGIDVDATWRGGWSFNSLENLRYSDRITSFNNVYESSRSRQTKENQTQGLEYIWKWGISRLRPVCTVWGRLQRLWSLKVHEAYLLIVFSSAILIIYINTYYHISKLEVSKTIVYIINQLQRYRVKETTKWT